jgi:nitroreductase
VNETMKTLLTRRSARKFKPQQITDEELKAVLDAGLYAPSGANRQSSLFIVVQDKETLKKIAAINAAVMGGNGNPYYDAPTVILVLADKNGNTYVEDASLVIGNMCNAAAALGLGSCWIHREKQMFESAEGKALLEAWGVSGDYAGVGSCILGYPDGPLPEAAPRRDGRIVYVR